MEGTKMIKVRLPVYVWEQFFSLYPDRMDRSRVIIKLISILIDVAQDHMSLLEIVHEKLQTEKETLQANGFLD